ncbi:DUF4454 domain-containing protein [Enterocloster citroniae]
MADQRGHGDENRLPWRYLPAERSGHRGRCKPGGRLREPASHLCVQRGRREKRGETDVFGNHLYYNSRGHFTAVYYLGD